jgi:hypothetical protein
MDGDAQRKIGSVRVIRMSAYQALLSPSISSGTITVAHVKAAGWTPSNFQACSDLPANARMTGGRSSRGVPALPCPGSAARMTTRRWRGAPRHRAAQSRPGTWAAPTCGKSCSRERQRLSRLEYVGRSGALAPRQAHGKDSFRALRAGLDLATVSLGDFAGDVQTQAKASI